MTNIEKEELLDALSVIQKNCTLNPDCHTCPLSNANGDCLITASVIAPKDWDIEKPKRRIWKALK